MVMLTLAALAVGLAVVFFGGGHIACPFADWRSFGVVFLGGTAATLASYPACVFARLPRLVWLALTTHHPVPTRDMEQIVGLARVARSDGILALEGMPCEDPFLRAGVALAVDGSEPALVMDILSTELQSAQERHAQGRRLVEALGRGWLIFAAIGVALVLVVRTRAGLPPMEVVRQAAAPALQGLVLSGLFAWPLARRLGELHEQEMLARRMAIEGIMAIQNGEHPRLVEHKLAVLLAPAHRPRRPAQPVVHAPAATPQAAGVEDMAQQTASFAAQQQTRALQQLRAIAAERTDEVSRRQLEDLAERTEAEGIGMVPLLAALGPDVRQELLAAMRSTPSTAVEAASSQADFDFGDFVLLADPDIQTLLREVEQRDMVVALKGAPDAVRDRFLSNMSSRARSFIAEEIACAQVHPADVLDAQARIVQQAHRLAQLGRVELGTGA